MKISFGDNFFEGRLVTFKITNTETKGKTNYLNFICAYTCMVLLREIINWNMQRLELIELNRIEKSCTEHG